MSAAWYAAEKLDERFAWLDREIRAGRGDRSPARPKPIGPTNGYGRAKRKRLEQRAEAMRQANADAAARREARVKSWETRRATTPLSKLIHPSVIPPETRNSENADFLDPTPSDCVASV